MAEKSIHTARLILRPLVSDDADALTQLIGDYEVSKWLSVVPHPYTRADADWFINSDLNEPGQTYALDAGDGIMGVISTEDELGYWLGRPFWRKGYMSEAASAVMQAWLDDPANADMTSGYFLGNEGSKRILSDLGFQPTAVEDTESRARGETVQSQRVLLTRQNWMARHG